MQVKVVVHQEAAGYWAEVPSIPGCVTQGDTMEELLANVQDAIEACLGIDVEQLITADSHASVVTIAI